MPATLIPLSPEPVLDVWQYCPSSASSAWIAPDGCCDLIWNAPAGAAPQWLLTPLVSSSYRVPCQAQQAMVGFRLRAGAQVDATHLLTAATGIDGRDQARALALLANLVRIDPRVEEALNGLAQASTLRDAQAQLGVSERSLERLLRQATGRAPMYWRALARARQAAQQVFGEEPLGQIASARGYTDQAHMGREFQRWFGASPGRMRRQPAPYAAVLASGYGSAAD